MPESMIIRQRQSGLVPAQPSLLERRLVVSQTAFDVAQQECRFLSFQRLARGNFCLAVKRKSPPSCMFCNSQFLLCGALPVTRHQRDWILTGPLLSSWKNMLPIFRDI